MWHFFRREPRGRGTRDDRDLFELLKHDAEAFWKTFLDRYSNFLFYQVRRFGFDYDEAMERFVYVLERLAENDLARLRKIRTLDEKGTFKGWLATACDRLCLDWLRSIEGREYTLKAVRDLPEMTQRILKLHFFEGMRASEIREELERECQQPVSLIDVLDRLEEIFGRLSGRSCWRLLHRLGGDREAPLEEELLEALAAGSGSPEGSIRDRETEEILEEVMAVLTSQERLVLQLRFEEHLSAGKIGRALGLEEVRVRSLLRTSLSKLRREMEERRLKPTDFSVLDVSGSSQ